MLDVWQNCYHDGWQGDIVPESFSHPAKFSRGLIHRIYKHAKEMGWVKRGDLILDPFGGVALGGLDAMFMGLNWIGIELEDKFVNLGQQNIDLWQRELAGWPNLGTARIIRGDSRELKTQGGPQKFYSSPKSPGQLGVIKEGSFDLCVSSPPYEHSLDTPKHGNDEKHGMKVDRCYSKNQSNLGNLSDGTFWSASQTIVQQCYELLKPGGHAIWVTKDYVKNKKRVPFSDRWLALCESVGFKLVCRHQAMLVRDHGTQITIDGEEKIRTERKSFFRRLAESKGSPRIDFEDILCFER